MGNCGSQTEFLEGSHASPQERSRNVKLNQELEEAQERAARVDKVLLLGAGESGKSTLFKQMRVIYGSGFSEKSRVALRAVVHANVIKAIQTLIQAGEALKGKVEGIDVTPENAAHVATVTGMAADEYLDSKSVQPISALWADPGIKARFEARHLFLLSDSAPYFLDRLGEISKEGYIPDLADVFRARVKTQGIVEDQFQLNDKKDTISMFDVGGQRSERRHWLHCFENVTAVLFVAAMSGFDMVLAEDATTNRMQEALNLFEDICSSRWFERTSIILFLNKRDLFEQKLEKVPLSVCFPEYAGARDNVTQAMEFIKDQFLARNMGDREIVTHFTTATDTSLVKRVFEAVKHIFLSGLLEDAGLMM